MDTSVCGWVLKKSGHRSETCFKNGILLEKSENWFYI